MTSFGLRLVGERAVMIDLVADPRSGDGTLVADPRSGDGTLVADPRSGDGTPPATAATSRRTAAAAAGTSRPYPAGVAAVVRRAAGEVGLEVVDVVPGATTVLCVAPDPEARDLLVDLVHRTLTATLDASATGLDRTDGDQARTVELVVRYDGQDLTAVAQASGLSVAEVIRRHSEPVYQAAFTGFAPGFAYLVGLDRALQLPRRATFRPMVRPGSVAIADGFSAVYPRASPGGWHLLGSTAAVMFDPSRTPAALVAPGDRVQFQVER